MIGLIADRIVSAVRASASADHENHCESSVSEYWRRTGDLISGGGPNVWTDSYLAAFASHTECTVVTLDRRFKAISNCGVLTLSA
jgi:predicted nucleic acid-binding protein